MLESDILFNEDGLCNKNQSLNYLTVIYFKVLRKVLAHVKSIIVPLCTTEIQTFVALNYVSGSFIDAAHNRRRSRSGCKLDGDIY